MSKRPRTVVSDDDSDVPSPPPTETVRARNKRLRADLYTGEEGDNDSQDFKDAEDTNGDSEGGRGSLEEPESPMTFPVTLRARRSKPSDDEYTESSESEPEAAEVTEEYSDGGFVVDSDDNLTRRRNTHPRQRNSRAYRRERREKARAKREKRARAANDSSDAFDGEESDASVGVSDTSIAEELRELNGNKREPKPRHYRERAPVDYSIPPPPSIEEVAASQPEPKQKARLRRLYDIQGPFGGADAVALFPLKKSDLEAISSSANINSSSINSTENSQKETDSLELADVDFSVVGGLDDYISKLKEMISLPLLYPELYERLGITPPRGVLFHGPPGTGKTLMARALAASHKKEKVAFYMRKGADILSKWIGESERQLRELFDEARANQPSIIFFDEIDGLAPVRSARQEQHHASIVSTLLALMDGMDNRGQVVVIGATNRPDSVDPALRRPGRFDREFYFPLPNLEARKRILEIHTRKWTPQPAHSLLATLAEQTKGYGGADLRALTTEAALLAVQHAYPQIYKSSEKLTIDSTLVQVSAQDFMLALERIQPASARPAAPAAAPLPTRIEPLLRKPLKLALNHVKQSLPALHAHSDAQAAVFLDGEQFSSSRSIAQFNSGRVHRPRLLFKGKQGSGHALVARAVAAALDGVYIVELGAAALATASLSAPESTIVSAFAELRRRSPSCLLLPDLSEWTGAALASLLAGLLRSLSPTEQVLILAAVDEDAANNELNEYFGSEEYTVCIDTSKPVLAEFFAPVFDFVRRKPVNCLSASEVERVSKRLKPVEASNNVSVNENGNNNVKDNGNNNVKENVNENVDESVNVNVNVSNKESVIESSKSVEESNKGEKDKGAPVFSEQDRKELRTRSQLKLKLGVILDGFRARFRRFRRPVIDESLLAFLFEPIQEGVEQPFVRTNNDMILETSTGKTYYNMDLETVEDRLWNGYYCEAIQFLEDVEKIYKDAVETGDRDRLHKAAEMLANAQVAVDDITADKEFARACRLLRVKDAQTRLRELNESNEYDESPDQLQVDTMNDVSNDASNDGSNGTHHINDINESVKVGETVIDAKNDSDSMITDPPANIANIAPLANPSIAPPTNSNIAPPANQNIMLPANSNIAHPTNPVHPTALQEHIEVPLVPPESSDLPVDSLKQEEPMEVDSLDFNGEFILNDLELESVQQEVYEKAAELTLERLEQFYAELSNTAWQFRLNWDRTEMVRAMRARCERDASSSTDA